MTAGSDTGIWTSSAMGHKSKPCKIHDTNAPDSEMGLVLAPETRATMATMAIGSEGRVHAQLSFKLQLLSLLVADPDPGEAGD